MGEFTYPLTIIGPEGEVTVDALVDTGATFSSLPRDVLERLGIRPARRTQFTLADERVVEYDVGYVTARIDSEEAATPCVFADRGAQPLLGAVTLETFLLTVDPIDQRLVPRSGNLRELSPCL